MDDPALRARLERGAAELAQQFTWGRIAVRTAAVYAATIRRQPASFSFR
jgi:glycosyltransferase involved in cell wall biosynthesis